MLWTRRKLLVWGSWSKRLTPMLIQRFLAPFMLQLMDNPNSHGPRTLLFSQPVKQHSPQLPTHPLTFVIKLVVSFIFAFTLFALFMVCLGSPGCGDQTMVLFYLLLFALIALFLGFGCHVPYMVVLRLNRLYIHTSGYPNTILVFAC